MSYCRANGVDSDVYVIRSIGGWVCYCPLSNFSSLETLRAHLQEHRAKGDRVPDRAFARIDREMAEGLRREGDQ